MAESKIARLQHTRLAGECAKLDPTYEQTMAEEMTSGDLAEWPKYSEAVAPDTPGPAAPGPLRS